MRIYLTNLDSDISGYKLALVEERNPAATTTAATAVTTLVNGSHSLTAGGTSTAMTLTAGGSAAKWITKPFTAAFTIPAIKPGVNFWAKTGSSAARHASCDFTVAKYTTSAQSDFVSVYTTSHANVSTTVNPDLNSSSVVNRRFPGVAPSATAIAAGNRLIITGKCVNAFLTSLVAQHSTTLTMDFDGSTDGADGDTFIDIPTAATPMAVGGVTKRQTTSNTAATAVSLGRGFYQNLIDNIDAAVATSKFTKDCSVQSFYNELVAERNNL